MKSYSQPNIISSLDLVEENKNSYPAHIIDKAIKSTINKFFQFNRQNGNNSPECSYVKLPCVGKFSAIAQKRIRRTIQHFVTTALISS